MRSYNQAKSAFVMRNANSHSAKNVGILQSVLANFDLSHDGEDTTPAAPAAPAAPAVPATPATPATNDSRVSELELANQKLLVELLETKNQRLQDELRHANKRQRVYASKESCSRSGESSSNVYRPVAAAPVGSTSEVAADDLECIKRMHAYIAKLTSELNPPGKTPSRGSAALVLSRGSGKTS